jgi:hypothetical protein
VQVDVGQSCRLTQSWPVAHAAASPHGCGVAPSPVPASELCDELQPTATIVPSSAQRSDRIDIAEKGNTPGAARRNSVACSGIGVYEGLVPAAGNCARCGAGVTAATSYMTEHGLLCWPCFTNLQNAQAATASRAADLDDSLFRRASWLAYLHGVMWASTIILATRPARLPDWLSGLLIVGAFVMAFGLRVRAAWAYRVAVVIDMAGVVALIAAGLARFELGRMLFCVFLSLFPATLWVLARVLRAAYLPRAAARATEVR